MPCLSVSLVLSLLSVLCVVINVLVVFQFSYFEKICNINVQYIQSDIPSQASLEYFPGIKQYTFQNRNIFFGDISYTGDNLKQP